MNQNPPGNERPIADKETKKNKCRTFGDECKKKDKDSTFINIKSQCWVFSSK